MRNKDQKVLYLFDEIGKIDDRFVNEAMQYESKRHSKGKIFARIMILAACIAVIMTLLVATAAGVTIGLVSEFIADTDKNASPNGDLDTVPPESDDMLFDTMSSLSVETLEAARVYSSPAQLVCDGNVRLIWTYGNGVYYSVKVDPSDTWALKEYLDSAEGTKKVEYGEKYGDFRFYISHGNGIVESPYLENNPGRVSFGTLSDYLPEIYPSGEFADFIAYLVEGAEN